MIILDFDDTLFDTARFKEARREVLLQLGVSDEAYIKTYMAARQTREGHMVYSDDRHADLLCHEGFDRDIMYEALHAVTEEMPAFLFADAHESIQALKLLNKRVVVVSVGDTQYNGLKVSKTRIDDVVDEVIITIKDKTEVLGRYIEAKPQREVWFVNDKVDETERVKEQWPEIRAVLKQSPTIPLAEYEKSGLPYFSTLSEIKEHICMSQHLV